MVKLMRSENYIVTSHGMDDYEEKNVLILIRNIAYRKQVAVYHRMKDGWWGDVPAHYLCKAGEDYELWGVNHEMFCDVGDIGLYGREFVIRYIVDNRIYWDNNCGSNYHLSESSHADGPGPMLGVGVNVLLRQASLNASGRLNAFIDVRNIHPHKAVSIRYTCDNWETSATLDANYIESFPTGHDSFIRFPNAYNIERWMVDAPTDIDGSKLQFIIEYDVAGFRYVDNNYSLNYSVAGREDTVLPYRDDEIDRRSG